MSSASKKDLADALSGRASWRYHNEDAPEWEDTPTGIIPVRKTPAPKPDVKGLLAKVKLPKQSFHCRLLCVMNCDHMFSLFEAANNAPTRDQIDRKAVGARHVFVAKAARAMANPGWKDSNGNGISLPNDHQNDSTAPLSLRSGLQGLDLVGTGTALLHALDRLEDGEPDYRELETHILPWFREIKAGHTVSVPVSRLRQECPPVRSCFVRAGGESTEMHPADTDTRHPRDARGLAPTAAIGCRSTVQTQTRYFRVLCVVLSANVLSRLG